MNHYIKNNTNSKYPIWCWVRCYRGICPPKHKGQPLKGFDVKITFNVDESEVFITDFRRYSFLLNNTYIPDSLSDKEEFENKLIKYGIIQDELKAYMRPDKYFGYRKDKEYLEMCKIIRKSFDKCITTESDVLQGCVWKIKLEDVENIEIIRYDGYIYGSINYVRSNGRRINWIEDLYKKIK